MRNVLLDDFEDRVTEITALLGKLQSELRGLQAVYQQDDLTGLLRRDPFFRRAKALKARAGDGGVGVMMIDVDHFKRFNDTHGHQAGDRLLRALGEILARHQSDRCVAGRYGGEEFALVCAGTKAECTALAEWLRRQVLETGCSVSIGLCHSATGGCSPGSSPGSSIEELIGKADRALYRAKDGGRNRVAAA